MTQQPMANPGREWAARWSRSIGEAIAHHRKEAGLTAAQLSERCAELGFPISRSQIAGMESGRKESVTVAEVQVLSRAIGVHPLLLLFPLGREQTVEVLPGVELPPWLEVRWWMHNYAPPVPVLDADGNPTGEWAPRAILRDGTIHRFHLHEGVVEGVEHARKELRGILRFPAEDREELRRHFMDTESRELDTLRTLRTLMRAEGLVPPPLPEGFLTEDRLDALLDSDELEDREDA